MNILITNANHFFGNTFLQSLHAQHNLWLIDDRQFHNSFDYFPKVHFLEGASDTNGPWIDQIPQSLDAIFNPSLHAYYTATSRRQIPKRLYETTINLVHLAQKNKPDIIKSFHSKFLALQLSIKFIYTLHLNSIPNLQNSTSTVLVIFRKFQIA